MDDTSAVDPATRCCLCHRILSSEIDTIGDLEAMNICRDCKFIFFENTHTTQTRYNNNNNRIESIENIPSQQFPDMQPTISNRLNQSTQPMSVLSDSGSDSYDSVLDNDEFEEVENTVGSYVGTIQLHRSLATNGRNLPADWLSEIFSDEGIRNNERRRLFGILDEPELEPSRYIDAETAGSRLGAPPAAVWFVKNLECVAVDEPGLVCVICKDGVCVGSVVNRLPCGHVYHPSCIVPWLNARSTCPLCRYELPTDDNDRSHWEEMPQQRGLSPESGGGRWWFVAVPVLSVVGVSVVWWFGGGVFGNQREDRSSRRWWLLL